MSDINVAFLEATRNKVRFASPQGQLSIEDLWDLPLVSQNEKTANLENIAIALHKQLKESENEISFVRPTTKSSAEVQTKFDIVKYILDIKLAERDARTLAAEKAASKQKLMAILSRKKEADLEGKSVEELEALLASI